MKSFDELECWKKAALLRKEVAILARKFPQEEKFRLTDQMIRCARSVTSNIAEGFGRFHYQEYAQFCRQSRGSLYEHIDHFTVAFEEGYITETEVNLWKKRIHECLAILNGFINYLLNAKKRTSADEPDVHYNTLTDAHTSDSIDLMTC
jgi:four helix bundle protein